MYDLVIKNGTVIDGTGADRRAADVGIKDGRIATVGVLQGDGERAIDATGKLVTPGFIDIHTHYDAQAHWDTTLSPVALARHHHGHRRQLWVHHRPTGRRAWRLPDANAQPGGGHAAGIAGHRGPVELELVRGVARPTRRNTRDQHRVHGGPQRHPTPGHGRTGRRSRSHAR